LSQKSINASDVPQYLEGFYNMTSSDYNGYQDRR